MAESTSKKFYQTWWFWTIIVVVIVAIIALACETAYRVQSGETTDGTSAETTDGTTSEEGTVETVSVPEDEMVAFCQETFADQITTYLNDHGYNYATIDIAGDVIDYNGNYSTNSSDQIVTALSWNSTDNSGQAVSFTCYATKLGQQIDMLYLSANGEDVMGASSAISTTSDDNESAESTEVTEVTESTEATE